MRGRGASQPRDGVDLSQTDHREARGRLYAGPTHGAGCEGASCGGHSASLALAGEGRACHAMRRRIRRSRLDWPLSGEVMLLLSSSALKSTTLFSHLLYWFQELRREATGERTTVDTWKAFIALPATNMITSRPDGKNWIFMCSNYD